MISSHVIRVTCTAILSTAILSACGGGGGDNSGNAGTTNVASQTSVASFPLQAGYKARVANGATNEFAISGACTGSARFSTSSPTSSSATGTTYLISHTTATSSFTNCTPSTSAVTTTTIYDTNYNLLGHGITGVEYGEFKTAPLALPSSVKVGDTAVYGTESLYTDTDKRFRKGERNYSYVVEPDGPSTAIVNLITKDFNTSNQLVVTQQSKYRITADGALTPVTMDIQFSTTNTNHFIFSAK